jgi:hypothetical protein
MNDNNFLSRKLSLELFYLGFEKPCFAFYEGESLNFSTVEKSYENYNDDNYFVLAPTSQQANKFFRDKFGLYTHIVPEFYMDQINFNWQILWYLPKKEWTKFVVSDGTMLYGDNGEYQTYELADLACIEKMIEIAKNK